MAADNPQFSFGDKLSIFSDKAYRKGSKYFEAVGNVVIISGKDTVYGELASMDQETGMVKIEGNVRLITKDLTLYGSHVEYNIATGAATIRSARILTTQFNLVASRLVRVSEDEYLAHDAEFTTCKDCTESWSVYGKVIRVEMNKNVEIRHGLAKIKGINVLYIPYMVFPISKRKSGLLFPTVSQRDGESLSLEQPVFWAINHSQDATITPTFWGKRGYGTDLQYRNRFRELSWIETNTRFLNDTIFEPGKENVTRSGTEYFRYFSDIETHQQFSSNLGSHLRYTDLRDLDIVRDHRLYTDPRINSSDVGLSGNLHFRRDRFALSTDAHYLRNQLVSDPTLFDRSYVQTLPRVNLATTPLSLFQTRTPGLQHGMLGFDGSYTRFRQVDDQDNPYLRNADRISVQPYFLWNLLSWGPVSLKTRYIFDSQTYAFSESKEPGAGKNAGLTRTEVSFTMDKIYGLAYEEKVPLRNISDKELQRLRERKEQGLTPIQTTERSQRLVGDLPPFETEFTQDTITQSRNSYRHSQEFKFVHHFIASENDFGNKRFRAQINRNQSGWFDYEDAYRDQEYRFGANTIRTIIPPENTMEFQWNNSLIRKSPKVFSYLEDDKFLRDNFLYTKVGYFNISQGYLLNDVDSEDLNDKLTRFMLDTGYATGRWAVSLQESYFHAEADNIFVLNINRRFDYLNLMASYRYESLDRDYNTLIAGSQVRPTDILGLAILKKIDFEANREVETIYSVDVMPHNNCWIFNLSYNQGLIDSRYQFNVIFNFGQAGFERYRSDYFSVKRW